mmetsp:Transcript_65401/g.105630  ORF Transcript_65401/g.105630 Transcript_65401/m.105630 type:complete len:95 (+) Transcript_65401:113-397(+)
MRSDSAVAHLLCVLLLLVILPYPLGPEIQNLENCCCLQPCAALEVSPCLTIAKGQEHGKKSFHPVQYRSSSVEMLRQLRCLQHWPTESLIPDER